MKIIKCPYCESKVDSKDIKRSWGNPFTRRIITCSNCGARLKTKIWLLLIWWSWVVLGVYYWVSGNESPLLSLALIGILGLIFSLMYFGVSHEKE